jgi:hypothetical protein
MTTLPTSRVPNERLSLDLNYPPYLVRANGTRVSQIQFAFEDQTHNHSTFSTLIDVLRGTIVQYAYSAPYFNAGIQVNIRSTVAQI